MYYKWIYQFRVTRAVGGAPVILKVEGPNDVKFTVDVVPSFKFELDCLKRSCLELHTNLVKIMQKFNMMDDIKVGCKK